MRKTILYLFILISTQVMAQQTLEKGIQTLLLKGAAMKNAMIEITGTNAIQNNNATSPSETTLEEIDLSYVVQVSSFDVNGTFKYGFGKKSNLAGTYIEVTGDSAKSKLIVNRMDNNSLISVKEYELPFIMHPGDTYKIKMGKRIFELFVEISNTQNHFLTDTLKYPSPFFGAAWGIPFIACSNGTISISDYSLSTPFYLSPRLIAMGDSFIEGASLGDDKKRYISFIKDSIGYENIAIMGKGGESSATLKNRFVTESNWFKGATYVLLPVGVNDVDFTTWKVNMTNYIQAFKEKGIIPIIATITPRSDRYSFIIEANNWIRTTYNGAYVDISKVVATDDINWLPGACMTDYLHPVAQSHKNIFYRIALEAPYLFRDKKIFTVDYLNESTGENVTDTIQYSVSSKFTSGFSSGLNRQISLSPGNDLYFRSTDPGKIKFIYDILLVPARPAPPSNISSSFTPGIFDWVNTPGFNHVSDYEYSVDKGNSWTTCSEKPVRNVAVDAIDLRVKAGTENFKSLSLHIDHLTGIAFQELNNITVYPNPVKRSLTIDHLTGQTLASVYASDGRLVKTISLTDESNSISLETFPEGVYMLVLVSDKGYSKRVKLIKEE